MKKLYQGKGRRVHPAPPPAPDAALAMLPAALLALAAALTAEEQEVLAYLLSGIGTGGASAAGGGAGRRTTTTKRHNGPHQPEMGCGCFGCYKSFWARWDASPNRHLIHTILDAVEEGSTAGPPGSSSTRRGGHRRRRRGRHAGPDLDAAVTKAAADTDAGQLGVGLQQVCCVSDGGEDGDYEGDEDDGADSVFDHDGEEAITDDSDCAGGNAAGEKSTVGKLVRFIGEKVWGPWT